MSAVMLAFGIDPKTQSLALIGLSMLFIFYQMMKIMFKKEQPKFKLSYKGARDREGRYHGKGDLKALNGDRYVGYFSEGRFHGNGKYFFQKGGGTLEGAWKNGQLHGKGEESYPDGSHYKGDFVASKRHGKGKLAYKSGASYEGWWKAGKKHGNGTMHYRDGSQYRGAFSAGKRHGTGVTRDKAGVKTYAEWRNGEVAKTYAAGDKVPNLRRGPDAAPLVDLGDVVGDDDGHQKKE